MRTQAVARQFLIVLFALLSACKSRTEYFVLSEFNGAVTSAPFAIHDEIAKPVLTRGSAGQWDAVDVLNPSIVRRGNQLLNYYSGFDGKVWRTGIATSIDGINWVKSPKNPILFPGGSWDTQYIAANGAAIEWKGHTLYFYQGTDAKGFTQIGLATSQDGEVFTKLPNPILGIGAKHAWDGKAVGDPYVINRGGMLYLYYLGMDEHDIQRLGVAKSPDGERWVKLTSNPIMDVGAAGSFDENGLGEPSVVFSAPNYYMIYSGRSADEKRDIGYAVSGDGVTWRKMSVYGLFGDEHRDGWNSKVICDTTILPSGDGTYTVWYGGGDIAKPDQGINGQIGSFKLKLNPPQLAKGFDATYNYTELGIHSSAILNGSWDVDGQSGARAAWVGPTASVTIWKSPLPGQAIIVSGWVPVSIYRKAGIVGPIGLKILLNGRMVAASSFVKDKSFTIRIGETAFEKMVPTDEPFRVTVETDHHFVPSAFTSSPDARALSLKLSRVSLSD